MKLLFDHNLSFKAAVALQPVFPGSTHVRNLNMQRAPDEEIWQYALKHGFVIISKDIDYFHRSALFGHPPKIIMVRLGNCATDRIIQLLNDRAQDIRDFYDDPIAPLFNLSEARFLF